MKTQVLLMALEGSAFILETADYADTGAAVN